MAKMSNSYLWASPVLMFLKRMSVQPRTKPKSSNYTFKLDRGFERTFPFKFSALIKKTLKFNL